MENIKNKPNIWFWVVAIGALLWNLMGVFAYLFDAYLTPEDIAGLPINQQEFIAARPAWVVGAYAIAVFGGTFGAIGLLLRKKWAHILFLLSLIAVIVQQTYMFLMSNALEVYGNEALYLPVVVLLIAVLLVLYAKNCIKKGLLK